MRLFGRNRMKDGGGDLLPAHQFSSRQVTIIVLAVVAAAILAPLGARATSINAASVNVVDPVHPATQIAHVDPSGNLQVGGTVNAAQSGTWNVGVSGGGNQAGVTKAGQLLATEAAPGVYQEIEAPLNRFNGCHVFTAPPTQGIIIKEIQVSVSEDPTPGFTDSVALFPSGICLFPAFTDVTPPSVGVTNLPVEPGFAIPPNGQFSAEAFGNVVADLFVFGYLVPAGDVHAATPIIGKVLGPRKP
jgi:hypothetical protein